MGTIIYQLDEYAMTVISNLVTRTRVKSRLLAYWLVLKKDRNGANAPSPRAVPESSNAGNEGAAQADTDRQLYQHR